MPGPPLLEIKKLWKHYGATPALRGVSASVRAGEVVALMGHNGAGKSTLVKILGGSVRQDSGDVLVNGKVLAPQVSAASAAGIAVIYQDLSLFPKLTVAENIFSRGAGRWSYSFTTAKEKAAEILKRAESDNALLDCLDAEIRELSLAMQQRVAIARALAHDSRILILDEPTASLSMEDAAHLLVHVKHLANSGVGVLFVSHRLADVQKVADRYIVLRDGAVTFSAASSESSGPVLAQAMFGEMPAGPHLSEPPKMAISRPSNVLSVRDATRAGDFQNISMTLRAGEIAVLTGLTGSGRTEFAESLAGLRRLDSGEICMLGSPLQPRGPRKAMHEGIIYIPEDRLRAGLFLKRTVGENLAGATWHLRSRFGFVAKENSIMEQWIADFGIRCEGPESSLRTLSGGNQQKVLLARWSMAKPRVLVLDEPTAGVDLKAKSEIHQRMRQWAAAGLALLVISSETEEVLELADRILVFHQGHLVWDSPRDQIDPSRLAAAMLHGTAPNGISPDGPSA